MAREGRSCEHFSGYKTINRTTLPLCHTYWRSHVIHIGIFKNLSQTSGFWGQMCRKLWQAFHANNHYLRISEIHIRITEFYFWISVNNFGYPYIISDIQNSFSNIQKSDEFWISVNEFWISVNEFWISVNEF